jgi:hypothetical protein
MFGTLFDRPLAGMGSACRAGAPPIQEGADIPVPIVSPQTSPEIPQTVTELSRTRKGRDAPATHFCQCPDYRERPLAMVLLI